MQDSVVPAYGRTTLSDLIAPIASSLTGEDADYEISIPAGKKYLLVLVDGLGWFNLQTAEAPYLRSLPAQQLTSAFPSTTATSLSSLCTGLTPGQHGIVGYSFRWKKHQVLNALSWEPGPVSPEAYQPYDTWFERLAAAGVNVGLNTLERFKDSGLTLAVMRGAGFYGFNDEFDYASRCAQIAAALDAGERSLIYVYERTLDHVGHTHGCGSARWAEQLLRIDGFLSRLRQTLDPDTRILITGDHGMVDTARTHRYVMEDDGLDSGLELFAGEPRMRQLYTATPAETAQRWARQLGERAEVLRREEAIERGLFGAEVTPDVGFRIGDVLVAMRSDWAVYTSRMPRELGMIGLHGSLSAAEMTIPLLID